VLGAMKIGESILMPSTSAAILRASPQGSAAPLGESGCSVTGRQSCPRVLQCIAPTYYNCARLSHQYEEHPEVLRHPLPV
jgi:hypothetical protein